MTDLDQQSPPETVFYDGDCGFCHRSVSFILKRDHDAAFRFAPLFGPTFLAMIAPAERQGLPDSLVVKCRDGRLLTRSAAALYIAGHLGAAWPILAFFGRFAPAFLRDFVYDRIAQIRLKLFAKPESTCPILPAELRRRFDP
jgi:predicted DCC family thiol-disulfide oxidoreductase YuxK